MIRLTQIDKWFGQHKVLNGIDLELAEGSVTALIGPSGSGKSTLLRCVNLLEIPQGGELQLGAAQIRFTDHHAPSRAQIQAIRQQTGMVFQNFQLFPHLTVIANVVEGLLTVQGWEKERAYQRAGELLEKVGMSHKAQASPAGSSSEWPSPALWLLRPRYYCAMSRPRRWILNWLWRWWLCCDSWPAKERPC